MLTSIATIAGCITALIGVFLMARRDARRKTIERYEEIEDELETKLSEAQTNEERARLIKLLNSHRNGK